MFPFLPSGFPNSKSVFFRVHPSLNQLPRNFPRLPDQIQITATPRWGQVLEMPCVAREEFISFCFLGNLGVPVIINPGSLDTPALRLVQCLQGFLQGQFLKFDFTGKISKLGGALVLGENHPVSISPFGKGSVRGFGIFYSRATSIKPMNLDPNR